MLRLSKRLELFFLASIPSLITLLLMVVYLVPKHMEGLGNIMPLLPLLPAFYWSMQHARAIPYWLIFLIGLVMDAATNPLGLSSLLYMFFLYLVSSQRRALHKEGFLAKWICFAVVLFIITGLMWLCLSWYEAKAMPFISAMVQWFLTVACYPVAHKLFDLLDQHLHARRWEILHG